MSAEAGLNSLFERTPGIRAGQSSHFERTGGTEAGSINLSVAWAAWTISESPEIHLWRDPTERWILVLVFFAYVLAWLPVALLPYDIGNNIYWHMTPSGCVHGDMAHLEPGWSTGDAMGVEGIWDDAEGGRDGERRE